MPDQPHQTDERVEMRAENIHVGIRLGPVFYVVESEQIAAFASALRTSNAMYRGPSSLAPPTMRLLDYAFLIAHHFKGGKGGVHAKHRCELFEPIHAGQALRVDGVITAADRKRGKFYFTLEYETRDASEGTLLTRQAITSILLDPEGRIGSV